MMTLDKFVTLIDRSGMSAANKEEIPACFGAVTIR